MITVDELKQLIAEAEQGQPELPADILNVEGFSAPRVKRLLNALCSHPQANYLEIGVHTGSTFIPAVYGHTAPATCIDNWSLYNGAREQFRRNVKRLIPKRKFEVVDSDCFAVDIEQCVPAGINVYFYDGDHSAKAQRDAILRYAPRLASRAVILIDDANWEEPREETKRAIRDLGWQVLYEVLLPGTYNGDQVGWWNGLLVELIEK